MGYETEQRMELHQKYIQLENKPTSELLDIEETIKIILNNRA